jgi:hypothetical protein
VPWEIATYLLGAQGGVEDDFSRLYAATNPVLMRYLRVTTDADPAALADLALGAWTAALPQLMACPPDEDAWLELIIGSARAAAAGSLRTADGSTPPENPSATLDDVDHAIEALRACPPEQAEVLAMGLVANLDRDATSRLTDHEPTAVLALVQDGQERLTMSLGELTEVLRAPGRDGEVADVRLVTPLITAALTGPAPTADVPTHAAPATTLVAAAPAAIGAAAAPAVGGPSQPPLAQLLGLESAATVSSPAIPLAALGSATGALSRPARVGVGVGVWGLAVGGVGLAAAMSGLVTVAIDGIFGDPRRGPQVTAQGPAQPGTPSDGGVTTGNPPVAPGQPGTNEPPGTSTGRTPQSVSVPGRSTGIEIVLASFVPQGPTPSTPTEIPPAPTPPTTTPPTSPPTTPPVAPPPGSDPGVSGGKGHGNGTASAREARRAIRQARATARATDKAAKAAARADSKADKDRGKGKALGHDKGKAHGKALGHDKAKANGKAVGHQKS